MSISSLSDRERQCLHLTCQGYRQKEIASRLGLSHRTVENMMQSARHKLRAKNIAQVAYLAGLENHFAKDSGVSPATNVQSLAVERIVVESLGR